MTDVKENLPLCEKYRPFKLEDIISHSEVITTCMRLHSEQVHTGVINPTLVISWSSRYGQNHVYIGSGEGLYGRPV